MSSLRHLVATWTSSPLRTLAFMQESNSSPDRDAGYTGPAQLAGLRDADWAIGLAHDRAGAKTGGAQRLYRWPLRPAQRATGLLFLPLDGNPRHGVLALLVDAGELFGAIEILERQGCWIVMPDTRRARILAASAQSRTGARPEPRSSIAGTPDRRFIFFTTQSDGATTTLVERRRDVPALLHEPLEPR